MRSDALSALVMVFCGDAQEIIFTSEGGDRSRWGVRIVLGVENNQFDCIRIQNLSHLLKWTSWFLSDDANMRLLLTSEQNPGLCTILSQIWGFDALALFLETEYALY